MSEGKKYASVVGFVQFAPEPKNIKGQNIVNFSVRAVGFTGQPLVQVTLWSEWEGDFDKVKLGDFVAVDGGYTGSPAPNGGTYHNINASKLYVNGEVITKGERTEGSSGVPAPSSDGGAF